MTVMNSICARITADGVGLKTVNHCKTYTCAPRGQETRDR